MMKAKQEEKKRVKLDEPIVVPVDHPVLGSVRFTLKSLRQQMADGDLERLLDDQYEGAGLQTVLVPHKAYLAYGHAVIVQADGFDPDPDTSKDGWQAELPVQWVLPVGRFMQQTYVPVAEAPAIEKAEAKN